MLLQSLIPLMITSPQSLIRFWRKEGTKTFRDFMVENFVFKDCDEEEIKLIISSLNVAKSSGPNSIPTDILLLLKDYICTIYTPLNKIFNTSLQTG